MFELKLMVQIMCWYPVHLAMGRCRVHAAKLRNRSKPREPEEKAVAVAAMDRSFWEAIAISLQAMASRLEAITTTTLQAIPRRLEAIATTTLQAIPSRLEAIASRVCVCDCAPHPFSRSPVDNVYIHTHLYVYTSIYVHILCKLKRVLENMCLKRGSSLCPTLGHKKMQTALGSALTTPNTTLSHVSKLRIPY